MPHTVARNHDSDCNTIANRLSDHRGDSREIGKHDDGRLTVGEWGDDVTEAERQAIADYEAEEARRYTEWRERNAHIFA